MHRRCSSYVTISTLISLSILAPAALYPQKAAPDDSFFLLNHATEFSSLHNGIEVRAGDACEQIVALREDILRIRIVRQGALPKDASWAVLPSALQNSIGVTPEITADWIGFRTQLLHLAKNISVDGSTASLQWKQSAEYLSFPIEDHGKGSDIELR
jgi:alpha-glucosidase